MCASWAGGGRFEFQKNMWNVYGCAGGGRFEFQKNMWNVCHMAGGGRFEFQEKHVENVAKVPQGFWVGCEQYI